MPRGRSSVCAEVCVCGCVDCLALCKQARLAACSQLNRERSENFRQANKKGICKVFAVLLGPR